MPPHESPAGLLVLHGVRLLGMADSAAVARRYSLDRDAVHEMLLDREAFGHVQHSAFADVSGWSLTERGRAEGERLLALELEDSGAREVVEQTHAGFAPLNGRFLEAITDWQIRPTSFDRMATNDHSDWAWDERVLKTLAGLARRLEPLGAELSGALARFAGYSERFSAALARVDRGERRWVDAPRIDSCHTVWFELHEDLISTLGLQRG
ncbi:MAG TPA: transcriptional regulator [Nocardioides sp.]|uniref:transcriptional regulator n=1 Tax=Nocardioides sp. TaxID=35761 RepID=UPI002D7EBB6E|nr:transcriptional regulator [Nocardioides sp.]HET6653544.1 transcriptional regulator [Nocardioides sp.]